MAFRINGEITLDGSGFQRGLSNVASSSAHFLKNFALGAFGVYGVEQAIHKTIESAKELINTSKNMSLTIEQLQVLRQAAKENGVEFETLTKALQKFNSVRENILNGGKGSAAQLAALGRLGVSKEALQTQTAGSTFMNQISQTAQRVNPADIAKDLRDVFGRGGQELFGTLQTNFGELENKMKSVGAIMDTAAAVELKNFKDEMDLVSQILISQLAPALVFLGKATVQLVTIFGTAGTYLGSLITGIVGYFKAGVKGGTTPAEDAKEYFNAQQAKIKATEDRYKALADKLNNPTPPVTAKEIPEEKKPKPPAIKKPEFPSDSLVSVGNFLGAGRSAINNIAQQQLDVAKLQLQKLDEIKTSIDNIEGVDFGG